MKHNTKDIFDSYVNEVAIYTRWLQKTQVQYSSRDPMTWDNHDYKTIDDWNDAMKMVERVLGLTEDEIAEVNRRSLELAKQDGRSEPWNYWVETPV